MRPAIPPVFRAALAAAALAAAASSAFAAEAVTVRAALHDGFGRIAFAWPSPVDYETRVEGEHLVIHFSRPLAATLDAVPKRLAPYVASVGFGEDHATIVATLRKPASVKAWKTTDGRTVAVDLSEPPGEPATAKPDSAALGAAKPVAVKRSAVSVRVRDHQGFRRLTFVWPRRIEYGFAEKDGTATLRFPAAMGFDAAQLAAAVPALAPRLAEEGDAATISLTVPSGIRLHAYRWRNDVILDVIGKPDEIAKPAKPAPPAPSAAAPAAPPVQAADNVHPAPPAAPPATASPPTAAVPATVAVHYAEEGETASLRFEWPIPTAAAVYRRGTGVWVVFAAATRLDLAEARRASAATGALRGLEQLPQDGATVLHFVPRDGVNPSVRRVGTTWILDLKRQRAAPDAPIALDVRSSLKPARIIFRVREAAPAVPLRDPEAGDRLLVVPIGDLGRGIDVQQGYVDFHALASVQGLVIRPNADDLVVTHTADTVEVSRPEGLAVSSAGDRALGRTPAAPHRLFDFAAWRGPADETFLKRRSVLERAVVSVPPAARSQPRLALARFYVAHLFGAEALGVLEAIARDDAELAATPAFQALKGAACLIEAEHDCAAQALGQHVLDGEPEAALWRGALAAETGDSAAAAHAFTGGVGLLAGYPKRLRDRMALDGAAAMLDTAQGAAAKPLLDYVLKDEPSRGDKAMALYLEGRQQQQAGKLDGALALWDAAARMDDRPSRARALYSRAVALFDAKKADRAATIKALDGLRFAWRGDTFEFALLRRLGELKLADGDYRGGLEALRMAADNFPDHPAAKDVRKELVDAFADLFLGKSAEDVPPLKALTVYDDFHAVAAGDRSAQIVRRLVDRLVAVDLLDRAAGLLDDELKARPPGLDLPRVATQLALLRLLDHKPDLALKALDIDTGGMPSPDIARQRDQLRARGLAELGRIDEALKTIAADPSRDADRLRADIFWRARNWPEAAKVFARLVGPPPADGKLPDETARLVLSWAAALTLEGDQAGLAALREGFAKPMAGTALADAFRVIAADGGAEKGDPREVARRVADIGDLQAFMASYKGRLANGKLSAIN